jgi:hypothetical protein
MKNKMEQIEDSSRYEDTALDRTSAHRNYNTIRGYEKKSLRDFMQGRRLHKAISLCSLI